MQVSEPLMMMGIAGNKHVFESDHVYRHRGLNGSYDQCNLAHAMAPDDSLGLLVRLGRNFQCVGLVATVHQARKERPVRWPIHRRCFGRFGHATVSDFRNLRICLDPTRARRRLPTVFPLVSLVLFKGTAFLTEEG